MTTQRAKAIQNKARVFRMTGERREAVLALVALVERHITESRDILEHGDQQRALAALEHGIMDLWNLRAFLKTSDLPE